MGRDWFHLAPSQGQTTFRGVGMDGGEMAGRSLKGVGRWAASTAYRSLSLEALSFPRGTTVADGMGLLAGVSLPMEKKNMSLSRQDGV